MLALGERQLQERSLKHPIATRTITANDTMIDTDILVKGNAAGGNITYTLLTAAGREGRRIIVKKIDATDNLVTIDAAGTETLDGALTISLTQKNACREYISDGTNWQLVAAFGNATSL